MNHNLMPNLAKYAKYFPKISDGKPIWRIGIYVRLSKEDKKKLKESPSVSILNQIRLQALKIASTLENFIVHDIYIDDGLTGTDFDRADYQRLQNDIDNKVINCYTVIDITRFVRNFAIGIQELESYVFSRNVRFITFSVPFVDTFLDPKSISSQEVYAALRRAEDTAMTTSIKVRENQEMKRLLGISTGGFPAFGWLPNPSEFEKTWLADPVAISIKEKACSLIKLGYSANGVARELNKLGIPNPTKYKESLDIGYKHPHSDSNSGLWSAKTVREMLLDMKNIGYMVQGKTSCFDHKRHKQIPQKKEDYYIVPDSIPRNMSDELYYEIVELLKANTRESKTGNIHMFSNLVYCEECKKAMKKTSGKNHFYLICRTRRDAGPEYCDAKGTLNLKVLEDLVLKVIQKQISLVLNLQTIIEEINNQPIVHNQSIRIEENIRRIEQEKVTLERDLITSYKDRNKNTISESMFQSFRIETEQRIEQLELTLRNLTIEQNAIIQGIKSNNIYFEQFIKYKNIETLDRMILLELISKIYVKKDKTIKIEFKYENQYLLILDFIERNKENIEIPKSRKLEK